MSESGARIAIAISCALSLFVGCGKGATTHTPSVDAPQRPQKPEFSDAVRAAESALGRRAEPMVQHDGTATPGAVMFHVANSSALDSVLKFHDRLEPLGAYLLVLEYGVPEATFHVGSGESAHDSTMPAEPDLIGLVPTIDQFEVVRLLGTNGNGQHSKEEIVAWLRALARAQPFALIGAGYNFVEGAFVGPLGDTQTLAHTLHTFCPDTWNSGQAFLEPGPAEPLIAKHLSEDRMFYCSWQ